MNDSQNNEQMQQEVKGGISLSLIFQLLRRSIVLILIFAIIGGVGGALYSASKTRVFSASRSILMKATVTDDTNSGSYSTANTTAGKYYTNQVKEVMLSQVVISLANVIYTADKNIPDNNFDATFDPAHDYDRTDPLFKPTYTKMAYEIYEGTFDPANYDDTAVEDANGVKHSNKIFTSGEIYLGQVAVTPSQEEYNYSMIVAFASGEDITVSEAKNYEIVREKLRCYIDASSVFVSLLRNPTEIDEDKQKSKFFEADVSFSTNLNPTSNVSSTNYMERNVIFGVIIGMILAIGLVVVLYVLDDTIKSKDELEAITGVKVFALIEDMKPAVKHKHSSSKGSYQKPTSKMGGK